jgi:hypothetical protein
MRVEIKTNGPVKDNDIKALYLIEQAMKISSPRMRKANIEFVASKYKIYVLP